MEVKINLNDVLFNIEKESGIKVSCSHPDPDSKGYICIKSQYRKAFIDIKGVGNVFVGVKEIDVYTQVENDDIYLCFWSTSYDIDEFFAELKEFFKSFGLENKTIYGGGNNV